MESLIELVLYNDSNKNEMIKKILCIILCLVLLCTALSGCGDSKTDTTDEEEVITRYTTEGKVTKLVGDESLTGELRACFIENENTLDEIKRVEKIYRELYPNVELTVDWRNAGDGLLYMQEYEKLQTEIMSGKGPDVIPVPSSTSDPYKMMESGAFADLAPYFEQDANFCISDFAENVLYSGQLDGKQFVIPTSFHVPLIITAQNVVDETGFNIEKCKDFISTGTEMLRVLKKNKLECDPKKATNFFVAPYFFLTQGNNNWINYKNDTVNLVDNDQVKKACEMAKGLNQYLPVDPDTGSFGDKGLDITKSLSDKTSMFFQLESDMYNEFLNAFRLLKAQKNPMVYFTMKNTQGQNQAYSYAPLGVSSNSKNIPAAYEFIKVMLSEDFVLKNSEEYGSELTTLLKGGFPLNKNAYRNYLSLQGTRGDNFFMENNEFLKMDPISPQEVDSIMECVYSVDCSRFDIQVIYNIMDELRPYIFFDADYDSCIKEAQEFAEIYVSE